MDFATPACTRGVASSLICTATIFFRVGAGLLVAVEDVGFGIVERGGQCLFTLTPRSPRHRRARAVLELFQGGDDDQVLSL
ncbi:hypothetical protein [Streptomyces sp. NRRL F-5650]|uniref:hypothetical protein n=1 Tax=Streptomyces sp. NRRL F-5650 TaxID=1463868 RepID=UPI00131C0828|nr:hypothetical protein [Streptomyces sp. NRRL F-5650]